MCLSYLIRSTHETVWNVLPWLIYLQHMCIHRIYIYIFYMYIYIYIYLSSMCVWAYEHVFILSKLLWAFAKNNSHSAQILKFIDVILFLLWDSILFFNFNIIYIIMKSSREKCSVIWQPRCTAKQLKCMIGRCNDWVTDWMTEWPTDEPLNYLRKANNKLCGFLFCCRKSK